MKKPLILAAMVILTTEAAAQAPLDFSGSVRLRAEAWDWFDSPQNDDYTFGGALLRLSITQKNPSLDWQVEAAAPVLVGLPDDAIAPAPQGQLGFGGSYFAANQDENTASLFVKQAFVRFRNVGAPGNSLRLGRFEFIDGMESAPKDPAVAAIKRDRVAHRLIGNFGWSHVGRSVDGVHFSSDFTAGNFTLAGGFPTRGVFDVEGMEPLEDVRFLYSSFTRPFSDRGDWRLFATAYQDDRGLVKTDNRPAAVRSTDRSRVTVYSLGGHYLHAFGAPARPHLLLWGNWQTGDWGNVDHDASAVAIEGGLSPAAAWNPALRAGWFHSSGDSSPLDGSHDTFFAMLPTPRIYARFPFFNSMNNEDLFVSLSLKPAAAIAIRADAHRLELSERADLWYVGGGAFDESVFGFVGRPGGSTSLGTLVDLSFDYSFSPAMSIGFYASRAFGGEVIERIYPAGEDASLFFVEFTRRF